MSVRIANSVRLQWWCPWRLRKIFGTPCRWTSSSSGMATMCMTSSSCWTKPVVSQSLRNSWCTWLRCMPTWTRQVSLRHWKVPGSNTLDTLAESDVTWKVLFEEMNWQTTVPIAALSWFQFVPAEHHQATDAVERMVGELSHKIELFLRNEEMVPRRAVYAMTSAHNHMARVGCFAPAQWAFGQQVEDLDNVALHSSEGTSEHAMSENLQLRLRAQKAYLELQARAKISRAFNTRSTPSERFLPGDLVSCKKHKTPADFPAHDLVDPPRLRISRWYGPGRVLARNSTNSSFHRVGGSSRTTEEIPCRPTSSCKWTWETHCRTDHCPNYAMDNKRPGICSSERSFWGPHNWMADEESQQATTASSFEIANSWCGRAKAITASTRPWTSTSTGTTWTSSSSSTSGRRSTWWACSTTWRRPTARSQCLCIHWKRSWDGISDWGQTPPDGCGLQSLEENCRTWRTSWRHCLPQTTERTWTSKSTPACEKGRVWERHQLVHWGAEWLRGDIPMPNDESEWGKIFKDPTKFAAKSVQKGAEVSWGKLDSQQRESIKEAKLAEVDQWIKEEVCQKYSGIIPSGRLMKMRWVLTPKSTSDPDKANCKARIVLLGYTDPDLETLQTSAPTATRGSRQLTLSLAMAKKWRLTKADAKSAFLQGTSNQADRNIFAVPVDELADALGIERGQAVKILKAAYGLVSAPREWFLAVNEVITKTCGMRQLRTDPCAWILDGPRLHHEPCWWLPHLWTSWRSGLGRMPFKVSRSFQMEPLGKHSISTLWSDRGPAGWFFLSIGPLRVHDQD